MGERARAAVFGDVTQKAPASYGEGFEVRKLRFGFLLSPPRFHSPAQYLGAFSLRDAKPASFPAVALHVGFLDVAAVFAGGFHVVGYLAVKVSKAGLMRSRQSQD